MSISPKGRGQTATEAVPLQADGLRLPQLLLPGLVQLGDDLLRFLSPTHTHSDQVLLVGSLDTAARRPTRRRSAASSLLMGSTGSASSPSSESTRMFPADAGSSPAGEHEENL